MNANGSAGVSARADIGAKGGHLVKEVKELIHEGNVRRIGIKDREGKTVLESL